MSSLKKIILGFSLFLGLATQSNLSAYNIAQLKDEVMRISQYADHCTTADLKEWLQKTIGSTYLTSNQLIVSITAIINDKQLYSCEKDNKLLLLMYEDNIKWNFYRGFYKGAAIGAYRTTCIGIICYLLYRNALRCLANHDAQLLAQAQNQAQQLFNANAAIINNQAQKK